MMIDGVIFTDTIEILVYIFDTMSTESGPKDLLDQNQDSVSSDLPHETLQREQISLLIILKGDFSL